MIEKIDKKKYVRTFEIEDKINEIIDKLNVVYFKVEHSIGLDDLYPKNIIKEECKYIKKEDLKEYLEALKDEADKENKGYSQLDLTNLILLNNGMKNCCDYIIKKFSL